MRQIDGGGKDAPSGSREAESVGRYSPGRLGSYRRFLGRLGRPKFRSGSEEVRSRPVIERANRKVLRSLKVADP